MQRFIYAAIISMFAMGSLVSLNLHAESDKDKACHFVGNAEDDVLMNLTDQCRKLMDKMCHNKKLSPTEGIEEAGCIAAVLALMDE